MDFFSHSLYPDNSGTLVLSSPLFALEVENLRLGELILNL